MKTDKQLQHDVMSELGWDPAINAAQIGVEAKEGVVTLAGEVSSYPEKWHAERAALRVAGVRSLVVEMDVRLAPLGQRTDTDIARSARSVLDWMCLVPINSVKVMVENGWLTLTGDVEWQYQREAAGDGLRHLIGVTGVSNQIALLPKASSQVVKSDIEGALKRRAKADAADISVDVIGSEVVLRGSVHSWSERDLATQSAWSSPGVKNVVDELTLTA